MSARIKDEVILVNDQDEPIGTMDKIEAHWGEGKLHRAISVYLLNKNGELLIQQRSSQKIVGAGQWANTCCGNVRPGESYEECAYRRLREELGITNVELQEIYVFQYFAKCNEEFSEREIDHVWVGRYDGEVQANPDEVAAIEWVSFPRVVQSVNTGTEREWAPWLEIMLGDTELKSRLEAYV